MTLVQPALDGSIPAPKIPAARRRIEDYETWVAEVWPVFVEVAKTRRRFVTWQIEDEYDLPDPPKRECDWGRLMARLHAEGIVEYAGFGLTRDKSGVRRWRGTTAAVEGRAA
ncbi:hypothetical protein DT019_03250 [Streptomyces sp. SDr-06]|uniref:hypothetical protein n=1 Tax=Streptomyces sp. SDr-06 TaxID=2267702 RepID=UPI000DEAD6B7|nr:hypothetical protein [Streptomyces sp. SDr-06]RCH70521.1 hypothetical protein DT019_03250 [Streptomyces sp. SDr-06]